ncbi:MAG TPA: peptidylprolyl isomerase [Candidatus Binatia bacterium]|nr:peptidylprolyl isomerase [Candidatus Binatia bacterium]
MSRPAAVLLVPLLLAAAAPQARTPAKPRTSAEILEASTPADWRTLDPAHTLYVELASGRVIVELAPGFAPNHVANIESLAREGYYDGLSIVRSQDNYVVQWGDPEEDAAKQKPVKTGKATLPAEFFRTLAADLPFTRSPDGDVYAPQVGWSSGFPSARDPAKNKAWLCHCYAMVGAGRGDTADSGGGKELYVVIGHAPRHLDKNVTLVGRVVQGMEKLSTLPRGTGPLGFYEKPGQYVALKSVRVAADVPAAERTALQLLRTDTATWKEYVASRRTRREDWFLDKAGHVELCNVPLPVRTPPPVKP